MSERTNRKKWLLYPEDSGKVNWDIFITVVLLVTCIFTPYNIAFGADDEPLVTKVFSYMIDVLFLVDIIIIFNSAFIDEEFICVEDKKKIAREYL